MSYHFLTLQTQSLYSVSRENPLYFHKFFVVFESYAYSLKPSKSSRLCFFPVALSNVWAFAYVLSISMVFLLPPLYTCLDQGEEVYSSAHAHHCSSSLGSSVCSPWFILSISLSCNAVSISHISVLSPPVNEDFITRLILLSWETATSIHMTIQMPQFLRHWKSYFHSLTSNDIFF